MEYIVKKSVVLKASPAKVWDALTNPEKTKQYFFNCEVFSDWQKGSPITFRGKLFFVKKIEMTGEILKIEPKKILQYTIKNTDSESVSTVTDEINIVNGGTVLSVSDDVGQGEDAEERFRRSQKGWDKVLRGLKNLVEKN
jgi:uncharacterized protein YndB with AHSA1/START domain